MNVNHTPTTQSIGFLLSGDGWAALMFSWRDDEIGGWCLVLLTNLVNSVAIYVCITHQLAPSSLLHPACCYWAELPRIKIPLQCHKVDRNHSSSCFQQCNVFIGTPACKISSLATRYLRYYSSQYIDEVLTPP